MRRADGNLLAHTVDGKSQCIVCATISNFRHEAWQQNVPSTGQAWVQVSAGIRTDILSDRFAPGGKFRA